MSSWYPVLQPLLVMLLLFAFMGCLWLLTGLPTLPGAGKLRDMVSRFAAGEVDNALRRMWPLWLLFAVCFGVVLFLNSMKAGLAIWGIAKVALAGPIGYLISYCTTARKHRPEALEDGIALGAALKSRDLIICATIVALAFGVP